MRRRFFCVFQKILADDLLMAAMFLEGSCSISLDLWPMYCMQNFKLFGRLVHEIWPFLYFPLQQHHLLIERRQIVHASLVEHGCLFIQILMYHNSICNCDETWSNGIYQILCKPIHFCRRWSIISVFQKMLNCRNPVRWTLWVIQANLFSRQSHVWGYEAHNSIVQSISKRVRTCYKATLHTESGNRGRWSQGSASRIEDLPL